MSVGKLIEARFLFVFTRLLILHGDIGGVTDRPHTRFQLCHKTNNPSEKRDIKIDWQKKGDPLLSEQSHRPNS